MKNLKQLLVLIGLVVSVNLAAGRGGMEIPVDGYAVKDDWQKSPDGTWPGMHAEKIYLYRLDKNMLLWWSPDGKSWSEVKNAMWVDKNGRWLKVNNSMLVWSDDMGRTWSEVPDWKWEAPDGYKYKFDKSWQLWVKK